MLNLDTHILVALLSGDLSANERELVTAESLAISDIVLWELAKLVELRRLEFDFDDVEFRTFIRSSTIFPITVEIARKSTKLDFRSDPADQIIAATSIVEQIPLLTRDQRILKSKLIPFPRPKR
jgi:PIN domain nuclease of toxin-antitoxin system